MLKQLPYLDIIDQPEWRQVAVAPIASAAGASLMGDYRNNNDSDPHMYYVGSATGLSRFNSFTDGWANLQSPLLSQFGAGSASIFHPSAGPRGTLAGGNTTTIINLSTALPAAVSVNQLANRGDDVGFKIRIIDSGAAGSGNMEERWIIANTSGTTPAITLDTPLTFTPVSGSKYEILSGRLYMVGIHASAAVASCSITIGSAAVILGSAVNGMVVGMGVSGTGIVPGTYIQAITDTTHITLSQNAVITNAAASLTLPILNLGTGVTTNASPFITYASNSTIVPGMLVNGTNITPGTKILKVINATTAVMNANATGTGSSLTFSFTGGGFSMYDVATNSITTLTSMHGNNTGVAAIGTDGALVSLSELHVPASKSPGQGFFGNINASAVGGSSITSTAAGAGADSAVKANEYRNFQIRVVQDLVNTTAVGQRARIASHTAGTPGVTAPVYTLYSAWGVTPSASAVYVIENDDDKILYFPALNPNVVTYNISTDVWDASTFAARGSLFTLNIALKAGSSNFCDLSSGNTTGLVIGSTIYGPSFTVNTLVTDNTGSTRFCVNTAVTVGGSNIVAYALPVPGVGSSYIQPFGLDRNSNVPHSFIFAFRGTTTFLDVFDIAGAATGSWTLGMPFAGAGAVNQAAVTGFIGESFSTGSCWAYAPATHNGRFAYLNFNASQRLMRFDVLNLNMTPWCYLKMTNSTAIAGSRMEVQMAISSLDNTKYSFLYYLTSTGTPIMAMLLK